MDGRPISPSSHSEFRKVQPLNDVPLGVVTLGLEYAFYEGDWDRLPDFASLLPQRQGTITSVAFWPRTREEHFGFVFWGYLWISTTGVYTFSTNSDDGSRLYIADSLVVDNDGLHGMQEAMGAVALSAGYHPVRITFFEKTGGDGLKVFYRGPGIPKQEIPDSLLFHSR